MDTTQYQAKNKIRIVTAASLFDGHDAAINIMRRIIQSTGVEVIHLGHDRSLVLIGILGIKVRAFVMVVLGIYINDQKVDSIKDSSSLSGTIGIVSADNTHITFDYFRVWTLK